MKPYFERFIQALPNLSDLAECPQEQLLKLWEGLGYYNRVRNMQEAACTVMKEYGGRLPQDYEALLTLKGIGRYTAGAIASIAYGIPVPAVDGNVLRVLMRVSEDHSVCQNRSGAFAAAGDTERTGWYVYTGADGTGGDRMCAEWRTKVHKVSMAAVLSGVPE